VLHRRIAEVLEAEPGEPAVELLAYHYTRSGLQDKAIFYLERAGDHAQAVHANSEAERHYRAAVELAHGLGDRAKEAKALEQWGWLCWWSSGDYTQARAVFEQAVAAYRAAGNWDGQVRTTAQFARVCARLGRAQEGLAHLTPLLETEEAQEAAMEHVSLTSRAELLTALADCSYHSGRYREQSAAAERAVRLAGASGDSETLARAQTLAGIALVLLGH